MARHHAKVMATAVATAAMLGLTASGAQAAIPLNVGLVGDLVGTVTDVVSLPLLSAEEPAAGLDDADLEVIDIQIPVPEILPRREPRPEAEEPEDAAPEASQAQPERERDADTEAEVVAPEPAAEPAAPAPAPQAPARVAAPVRRPAAPAPARTYSNTDTALATVRNLTALLGDPVQQELDRSSLTLRLKEIDESARAQRVTQYAYPATSETPDDGSLPTALLVGLGVALVVLHTVANRLRWGPADRRGLRLRD